MDPNALTLLLDNDTVRAYLMSVAGIMAGAKLLTSATASLFPRWGRPQIKNDLVGDGATVTTDVRGLYLKLTAGAYSLALTVLAWATGLLVGELPALAGTVLAGWWMSMGLHTSLKIVPMYRRLAEALERVVAGLRSPTPLALAGVLVLCSVSLAGCVGPPNVRYESPVGSVAEQVDRRAASYLALAHRIAAARGGGLIDDGAWPAIRAANAVVVSRIDTARDHVNADRLAEARLALDALDASAEVVEAAALAILPALASPAPADHPDPIGARRVAEPPETRLLE